MNSTESDRVPFLTVGALYACRSCDSIAVATGENTWPHPEVPCAEHPGATTMRRYSVGRGYVVPVEAWPGSRDELLAMVRAQRAGSLRNEELSGLMRRLEIGMVGTDPAREHIAADQCGACAEVRFTGVTTNSHACRDMAVEMSGVRDTNPASSPLANALGPVDHRRLEDAAWFGCTSTDLRANVHAFHAAVGQAEADRPTVPSDATVRLRARLIVEECFETLRSMFDVGFASDVEADLIFDVNNRKISVDITELADGLADLMYVCEGAFLVFGIDSRPVHAEVQRSNMAKAGGPKRADGKIMKPAGWTPPDIAGVIGRQIAQHDARGGCAFCGRKSGQVRQLNMSDGIVVVCADPIRDGDKPMPPNCAWRYCARATDGRHNPGDTGDCKTCGKPVHVGK